PDDYELDEDLVDEDVRGAASDPIDCSNAKPSNMPGSRLTTSWRVKSKPSNFSCCRRGIGRSVAVGSRQTSSPYRRRPKPDAPPAGRFRCVHEYEWFMGIVTSIGRRYR